MKLRQVIPVQFNWRVEIAFDKHLCRTSNSTLHRCARQLHIIINMLDSYMYRTRL